MVMSLTSQKTEIDFLILRKASRLQPAKQGLMNFYRVRKKGVNYLKYKTFIPCLGDKWSLSKAFVIINKQLAIYSILTRPQPACGGFCY